MSAAPVLAWVEHCLPAEDAAGRVRLARHFGLALEVANREGAPLEEARVAGVRVVTLQAFGMHEAHPLHPDPRRRDAGMAHLRETIEMAARAGVPRVVAACGFGRPVCQRPFESCRSFFATVAEHARRRGVRVLIEPLSRLRAGAMTGGDEIQRLLDELAAPDVFGSVIDTGHLLDDGLDPSAFLAGWRHAVDELQLRGPGSRPPSPSDAIERWIAALPVPPAVVAVEHRAAIQPAGIEALLPRLRGAVGAAGARRP